MHKSKQNPTKAQPDQALPYETALAELIDKIVPGLDSGDILADAKRASMALAQAEQWISVNERLPEIKEWREGSIAGISDAVLTIDEDDPDTMTIQCLRKGGQGDLTTLYWDHGDCPTHWKPAPQPPAIDAARKEQT